jgi:hypothetical protein
MERPKLLAWLALELAENSRLLSNPMTRGRRIVGANMAFRKEVFEDFGGFDAALGHRGRRLYGGEEVAFVNNLLTAGRVIAYCPEVVVFHRIENDRVRKMFFLQRIFDDAAGAVGSETDGLPGAPRLFGVERWRYRPLLRVLIRAAWRSALRHPGRLDDQLELASSAGGVWGQIVAAIRRKGKAGAG